MHPSSNLIRPIVLASASPRRQELMRQAGFKFTVRSPHVDESFPADLPVLNVALFLAEKKAASFGPVVGDEIVIAADTTVVIGETVLNKPETADEARAMLRQLSGNTHMVVTGVCMVANSKKRSFAEATSVTFVELTDHEIEYYIKTHKPFDKAGAYGIQDWIGQIGISTISGSYYNVVGLPIHRVYRELVNWQ